MTTLPDSVPLYGHYERFKYPNWAKFFFDALVASQELDNRPVADGRLHVATVGVPFGLAMAALPRA